MLVLESVSWRPRLRPWRLQPEVARSLGALHAATGAAHGDFAPWNLLETEEGWTLLDWEESRPAPPFYDPLFYLVRSHGHLGRPSRRAVIAGLRGRGWVGAALSAYAVAAGVQLGDARATLDSLTPDEKDDPRTRQAMAAALER
jgi:aminoglycoside phosphotransferase (APT) family kinase protein